MNEPNRGHDPAITTLTYRCTICPGHDCTRTIKVDADSFYADPERKPRQNCNAYPTMDGSTNWKLIKE